MRSKIAIVLMVGLVASLCALTTWAQEKEQKAQLYLIWDIQINPSMLAEYDATTKEMVTLFAKYKFPYHLYAYRTGDYHDYFVAPIESHAAIDDVFKHFAQMPEEEWSALVKHFSGTYDSEKIQTIMLRPDLSHMPEEPRLEPEEEKFMQMSFCYVIPGKEKEFEENFRQIMMLLKSKNIPSAVKTHFGLTGTDNPVYIYTISAKNSSDYHVQHAKELEIAGDEVGKFWNKILGCLRKYENKTCWYRPDLSYIPEEK